jgi:hypothetical protein
VSARIPLAQINEGYARIGDGDIARSIVVFGWTGHGSHRHRADAHGFCAVAAQCVKVVFTLTEEGRSN